MRNREISVIIPVYNTADYLADCLDSILTAQTFRNFVVICCDDCSTDDSPAILARYVEQYPEQMRIIKHKRNSGAASALNTLIDVVETPYITFQDSDDIMHPERLQRTFDFLERNKDIDVVGSWVVLFRDRFPSANSFVKRYHSDDHAIRSLLLFESSMGGGAVVSIRTASLRTANIRQDEQLTGSSAHDYDFFVRLAPHVRFANIPEPLYYYRIHNRQSSTAGHVQQLQSAIVVSQRYLSQFGIAVSGNTLRIFHTGDSLLLLRNLLLLRRRELRRMITDIKGIKNFYDYPCVSSVAITTLRTKARSAIRRHLLKFPLLLYREIVARYPIVQRMVSGCPWIWHYHRITQTLYRTLVQ